MAFWRRLVEHICFKNWGVPTPQEFQIQAIYRGVFYNDSFELVAAKTENGRFLIALSISLMRRGVSIIQVPLHSLGLDQVSGAIHIDRNIEAWSVDEFCGK